MVTESHTTLRVLVAAPRPMTLEPLPSRHHVRALLDALEAQGDRVEIQWLAPATPEALASRLAGDGGPAPDAVVLDVALTGDGERVARLEGASPTDDAATTAAALGAILRQGSARLVVLRPAMAVGADDAAAYAEALAREAERAVVRIDARLDGDAVRAAMTAALTAVLAGHGPAAVVEEARKALSERGTDGDPVDGIAWHGSEDGPVIAPRVVEQGVSKVVRFPGVELQPPWRRLAQEPAEGGLPTEPEHGWFGRTAEMLALERAAHVEAGNAITLIHGYTGSGRTALAAHAARWLVRTGRFQQAVYVTYAEGGYAERALHALGTRLIGERFDLRAPDAVADVERALAETPTLIIWDDVDALLPEGSAAIAAAELEDLLKLGAQLAAIGATHLWVVSQVAALPHPAYRQGALSLALPLGELAADDAVALARAVWPAEALFGVDDATLRGFLWRLGGLPLAVRALAPLLAQGTLDDAASAFAEALAGFEAGEARYGDQAVHLVLQAIVRAVGEELVPKLEALGVFAGGLMRPLAGNVAELEDAAWERIERLLVAAGLVRPLELPGYSVPYLCFHPALSQHLARRLAPPVRTMALPRHAGAYLGLLKWMTQNVAQHGAVVRALALRELANFRRGLDTLCAAHELNVASDFAHEWQRFLVELGFRAEHREAARRLREAVAEVAPAEGPLQRAGVRFLLHQGEQLMAAGRAPEAAVVLQQLVERLGAEGGTTYRGPEVLFDRAQAQRRLGRALVVLGRGDAAVAALTAALTALSGAADDEARQEAMLAQQDLGDAYLAGGHPAEAEAAYQQALEMARERNDRRLMGTLSAQLGTIAMAQDEETARQHLETALFHLQTLDDAAGMSAIWSQLGTLAWRASDLDEAERCYRQALELARQAGQPVAEAQVHLQLALTARQADRLRDAEAEYLQAIRLYQDHNVRTGLISAEMALAELLLSEGEIERARVHAEAARAAVEDPRVAFDGWAVYALLQRIAEAQGDAERVAHWRAMAQESFARSPEAQQVLQQWQQVIDGVASAARGEALAAHTVTLLEQLEERQEWHALVGIIWRILGGERGHALYAELDHVDALVVRRILEAIDAPAAAPEDAEAAAQGQEGWPVPLPQLMRAVVAGLRGDANARRLVAVALARMAQEDAPESARRFADVLARILRGERDEAMLAELPKEMADPLLTLLRALRQVNTRH